MSAFPFKAASIWSALGVSNRGVLPWFGANPTTPAAGGGTTTPTPTTPPAGTTPTPPPACTCPTFTSSRPQDVDGLTNEALIDACETGKARMLGRESFEDAVEGKWCRDSFPGIAVNSRPSEACCSRDWWETDYGKAHVARERAAAAVPYEQISSIIEGLDTPGGAEGTQDRIELQTTREAAPSKSSVLGLSPTGIVVAGIAAAAVGFFYLRRRKRGRR